MADNESAEAANAQVKKTVSEDDQTAKIPRPNQPAGNGKVVLNSNTDSTIKPSDPTRIAPAIPQPGANAKPKVSPPKPASAKTIKLKPVTEEASDDQDVGETISVDRNELSGAAAAPAVAKNDAAPIAKPAKSKTIKLKPLKPQNSVEEDNELGDTLSLDKDSLTDIPADALKPKAAAPSGNADDEATIKIQKPATNKPSHPVPNMPGAKETIKLRPSNNTPPPPSAPTVDLSNPAAGAPAPQAEGKRTIKLVPKKAEDDSTQKTPKPPGPSDPTVNLQEVAETPAAPPPSPSAPTMKMADDGAQATKPAQSKKTLKLKSVSAPATAPAATDSSADQGGAAAAQDSAEPTVPTLDAPDDADAEPNIIFTLVALITLCLLAYFAYLAGTQFMALNA